MLSADPAGCSTVPGGGLSISITCDSTTSYILRVYSDNLCTTLAATASGQVGVCLSAGSATHPTSILARCATTQAAAMQASRNDLDAAQTAASSDHKSFPLAIVVGAAGGALVLLLVIGILCFVSQRHRNQQKTVAPQPPLKAGAPMYLTPSYKQYPTSPVQEV